jgi:tRNA(Ile2) C34 agmatinyltransferase TiaS
MIDVLMLLIDDIEELWDKNMNRCLRCNRVLSEYLIANGKRYMRCRVCGYNAYEPQ